MFKKIFARGVTLKRLVVLGGGVLSKPIYVKLNVGGFYTICMDKNKDAPCKDIADEFYPIDISNNIGVLRKSKQLDVDGIMAINEFGTKSAAFVADLLNLHGNSIYSTHTSNNKIAMRNRWEMRGLMQPKYSKFYTRNEFQTAIEYIGYPAVIKPPESGGGGRGVSVVKNSSDILWAYTFAKPYTGDGELIVEQYIEGTELTVETFSNNGKVTVLAMSDKIKPDLKTRVATRLTYPAELPDAYYKRAEALAINAVKSLGIQTGMAHTEIIITSDGVPYLIETASRGGGGHIFHTIIEEVSGFNAPVQTARILTGLPVSVGEMTHRGCVYGFFAPPAGILESVEGLDFARHIDGVIEIELLKHIGERVGSFENSLERCGYFVTRGETREDAISVANRVESVVNFNVGDK